MKRQIASYKRFKAIFKKGEQVCVGGMDWETHGYVTKIDEDGVVLTQLRNKKGIKYPWNCFEVIYHAGYIFSKEHETSVRFYGYDGAEFAWEELEVIGNIHENPELLKQGGK